MYFLSLSELLDEIRDNSSHIFIGGNIPSDFNKILIKHDQKTKDYFILIQYLCHNDFCSGFNVADDAPLCSTLMHGGRKQHTAPGFRKTVAENAKQNFEQYHEHSAKLMKKTFSQVQEAFSLASLPNIKSCILKMYQNEDVNDRTIATFIFGAEIQRNFPECFWCIFQLALLQDKFKLLSSYLQQRPFVNDLIAQKNSLRFPEVLKMRDFFDLRKSLVKHASGQIYISGSSLRDAFRIDSDESIIEELRYAIQDGHLHKIHLFLTDPEMLCTGDPRIADLRVSDALNDINGTIHSLQRNFYSLAEYYRCELNIYFLSLPQIDHAVISDGFMLFRSTKLWDASRLYKGNFMLYALNPLSDKEYEDEYKAHLKYLDKIISLSTKIYPAIDRPIAPAENNSPLWYHSQWREYLENTNYTYIKLFKLYHQQILSFLNSSWGGKNVFGQFYPSVKANSRLLSDYNHFFNADYLLNGDNTQKALLPYLKETERLFDEAIEKHGHPGNKDGKCRIFPSLDLGFPNNIQRLAGGFATGMVITWNCGVDIVPIDATVNVCTSSVFKLNREYIKSEWLDSECRLASFNRYVEELSDVASKSHGYSFSFESGNHFLMLAQDKETQEYYLVLHSSANELKQSYMGLYPVENNWYSNKIKTVYNESKTRYFRYLKDSDAKYFIQMAHNFQGYNEQIHQWVAEQFNGGKPLSTKNDKETRWMYHHYYMPTNQAICIGTFAEAPGTQVPVFSISGKPIVIFEIGEDNWTVNLGAGKERVCLVPHGWGQEVEGIEHISVKNVENPAERVLCLTFGDASAAEFKVKTEKSEKDGKRKGIDLPQKHVRNFPDNHSFFESGKKYISGKIVKTLTPIVEYSSTSKKML